MNIHKAGQEKCQKANTPPTCIRASQTALVQLTPLGNRSESFPVGRATTEERPEVDACEGPGAGVTALVASDVVVILDSERRVVSAESTQPSSTALGPGL